MGIVQHLSFNLSPSDFSLVNGADLTGSGTVLLDVYQTGVDFRFAEGFQLSIRQESLSQSALDYWAQVKRVLNRTGTIAEEPVGEVLGNWTSVDDPDEVVYGLFYAVDQTSSDVFVHPDEVGNPAHFCPQPAFDAETANLCNDCQAAWPEGDSWLVPPDNWGG